MNISNIAFKELFEGGTRNGIYKSNEFMGRGIKLVKMNQLFGQRFVHDKIPGYEFIELTSDEVDRFSLQRDDLLFSRTSVVPEGVGICSIVDDTGDGLAFESNIIRVRLCKKYVNPEYVFRYFQSSQGRGAILAIAGGTNIRTIKASTLSELKIPLVNRRAQDSTVKILRTYDRLIENNLRRIQLLEESARLLYKEWFVHLRFPGHEHVKIVAGVPKGWKELSVKDCCQAVSYGYTASASKENIGPKLLRITDIAPSSIIWDSVPFCDADETITNKYKLYEGDIVVARTGATVGYAKRIPKLDFDVVYASYLVRFKPDPQIVDDLLLGIFMESNEFKNYVLSNSGGSAQPNANAQVLGGAKLLVPSRNIQSIFRESVNANFLQKQVLEKQISNLKKARDLILPRLMNGELAV